MDIRVLRYFLAIAREGSITSAAGSLHVTQPTLSRQIKELEEELGQQLFIRKSRTMALTREGMILRKRAEEIVAMVDKTEAEFSAMETAVAGDIYIGGGETQAIGLIAEVVSAMRDAYPDIRFHLYSGNDADVTERLDKGLLDFGILIQPADLSKYDYLNLPARDRWGVIMRKDSPLAAKATIEKSDLLDLPLICSRQAIAPHHSGNEFADWFGNDFDRLNIVCTFNLVFNATIMVEAGVGYALGLDGLANTAPDSALCFRPLAPQLESGLAIVWKKYPVFSDAAELFLDSLRAQISGS
ncbi:MAG: LysR family transcriptional regulator [Peptococcaceae bacterium]|nr:LysR family transcriptional regulator [Peptococcaceae bacterium]